MLVLILASTVFVSFSGSPQSTFQNAKSTLKKKRPMVSLFAYLHSISFPMKVIISIFQWIDQRSFYVLFGLLLFYSSDLALTDILDFT